MDFEHERRRLLLSIGGGIASSIAGCSDVTTPPSGGGMATDGGTATDDVRLIAHRGCADQYPENTVLAVEKSAPHVDMVEVDVQRCGSGELVVFHDDELDRLTDASGAVSTTDWETLSELTVLDSDQTIPLLSEILAAVPDDTDVNVELKHSGMAEDVLETVDGVANEVIYSSFSGSALWEVRERDDGAPLALITDDSPEISRSIAADLDCVAVNPGTDLVFTSDVVAAAHEDGFEVNVWTINDGETATRVAEAGADGLFVDRWDVL